MYRRLTHLAAVGIASFVAIPVATARTNAAASQPPTTRSMLSSASPRVRSDAGGRDRIRANSPVGRAILAGRDEEQNRDDAGSSASFTTPIYFQSSSLSYVQPSPKIYIDYWGNWSGDQLGVMYRLKDFYANVGGSAWNQTQTQYGMNCVVGTTTCTSSSTMITNPYGQWRGWINHNVSIPASPTADQIAAEARWAASYFGDTSFNAQYIIALPSGHRDQKSVSSSFCAWHNFTTSNNGYLVSYTSMPYIPDMGSLCGAYSVNNTSAGALDGVTIYAGHEYAESETDPFLGSWADTDGNENADKCLQSYSDFRRSITFGQFSFVVQPLWSNTSYFAGLGGCAYWS
jgi:hypothetical protein